jgi:uncharacterized RDD family membrane protein YckC
VAKPTSRLIEFPGVTRRTVPPWRRELSERVREVQERRAQEAAAEGEATNPVSADAANLPPQLELLPQAEALAVNPLVVAALRRIERAHQPGQDLRPSHPAVLSAAVGTTDAGTARHELRQDNGTSRLAVSAILFDEPCNETETATLQSTADRNPVAVATIPDSKEFSFGEIELDPEPAVNLAAAPLTPVPPAPIVAEANTSAEGESAPDVAPTKPKPKRIISDDASDPALNYLDLIGVASPKEVDRDNRAPVFSRLIAGVIDLLSVGFLSVPFAAVIELRNDNWREPRVALFMSSVAIVVMFIYLTMTTALTGKTLGMRILSLRVIDTRTRLIPTGKQAAGRAIVYILSLATAGVGFLVALARGEGKTVHDRLSRTAVVRD